MAGQVAVRTGRAVARDRAQHDPRVDLAQLLEAEAAPGEPAGTHRLDHDVRLAHQVEEQLDALLGPQVDHDAALPPVHVEVHQRDALDDRPGHPAHVVALRRLDLDHLGPEVGQRGGDRGGTEHRDLDDPHAREQSTVRPSFSTSRAASIRAPDTSRAGPVGRGLSAVPARA